MNDEKHYYSLKSVTLEELISEFGDLDERYLLNILHDNIYESDDIDYIPSELLSRHVEYWKRKLVPAGWLVTVSLFEPEEKTETPEQKVLKRFVQYLKDHSTMYDYDTFGHYNSFRAVDVDDLDDLLNEFIEED